MRTAIYIEQGMLQVVLTPETEQETNVLALVEAKQRVSFYRGSFYGCRGGWIRQKEEPSVGMFDYGYGRGREFNNDDSLIIVLKDKEPEVTE